MLLCSPRTPPGPGGAGARKKGGVNSFEPEAGFPLVLPVNWPRGVFTLNPGDPYGSPTLFSKLRVVRFPLSQKNPMEVLLEFPVLFGLREPGKLYSITPASSEPTSAAPRYPSNRFASFRPGIWGKSAFPRNFPGSNKFPGSTPGFRGRNRHRATAGHAFRFSIRPTPSLCVSSRWAGVRPNTSGYPVRRVRCFY